MGYGRRWRMTLIGLLLVLASPAEAGQSFKEVVIKTKIQKPEIQILITKRNLTPKYELDLKESFLPQIIEAAEKKPF